MRVLFLGLFFVLSGSVLSQKTYSFDYVLEYNTQVKEGAPIKKEYFYTNSKDNSYKLHVVDKDSLNFTVDFLDVIGNHAVLYFSKADFLKATSITVPCKFVKYFSTVNLRTKDYGFASLNDTVVNGVSYFHYVLKSISSKREKRNKLSRAHYIIEKESVFHLPVFFRSLDLEVWKRVRSVPNGIPFIEFFVNPVNQEVSTIRKLVKKEAISMQLTVPDECDSEKTRRNVSAKIVNESYQRQ
jgi:hypothetical protein